MKILFSVAVALLLLVSPAWAGSRTVTLVVPGMNCSACPITVKRALTKVTGVSNVRVDFDKREAVVTFDDTKTTTAALIEATTDAGYPSTVKRK